MTRSFVAAAIALGIPAMQPDAARVLADMRQALGGDAAIAAVQAFSVSGTESHNFGGRGSSEDLEWTVALPDSVVRVRRMSTPPSGDVMISGFRGDARILRLKSDLPHPPDRFASDTPEQRAARDADTVRYLKHDFSRFAIALIGIPAVDPLEASYLVQRTVAGRKCDVLQLRSTDGYTATLAVDAATHLPVMVNWVGRAEGLTADPLEWQLYYEDFRLADGLNWPHRFVEKTGARVWTTTQLGKFKLNPKIDPELFDPARR